jgi:hypothetical protein
VLSVSASSTMAAPDLHLSHSHDEATFCLPVDGVYVDSCPAW